MSKEIKGYKVLRPNYTCRDKQYSCPGEFEEDLMPSACNCGMHFCINIADCFNYYPFDSQNKVVAYGDINKYGDKCATNKLRIIREISWEEVLRMVNTGKSNSGRCNSGNRNSGDWNSGDWNSGDWNSGNRNSGDWNSTDGSSGCFNTEKAKILMFNKPSDWTLEDWLRSEARWLLNDIDFNVVEWIWSNNMTDEEKEAHPEHKTTGGYLKEVSNEESCINWWRNLGNAGKQVITSLPNFDAEIFKEITGIDVSE